MRMSNLPTQQQIDRVRDYVAMMRGVPSERVSLFSIVKGSGHPLQDCGTLACGIGWAASFPAFNEQGLTLKEKKDTYGKYFALFYKERFKTSTLSIFFGACEHLFYVRGLSKYDWEAPVRNLNDRDLAIYRALRWLNDNGHPCSLEIQAVTP